MKIKKFLISLLLMMFTIAAMQAQEWNPNYDLLENQSSEKVTDSIKTKSQDEDVNKLKTRLDNAEKQQQYQQVWNKKSYLKIGLDFSDIKRTDGMPMAWDTQISAFIQLGKTVYFHSKPIAGMIKIGLDYSFLNLGYAKLKLNSIDTKTNNDTPSGSDSADGFGDIVSDDPSNDSSWLNGINLGMHKFDYGLHVGPSISINPWNHIIISAYFHAMPMFSGILENKKFSYGFGCAVTGGASVSYKLISVGVEGIWDSIKYHQTSFDGQNDDNIITSEKFKLKQSGPRVYLAFRF